MKKKTSRHFPKSRLKRTTFTHLERQGPSESLLDIQLQDDSQKDTVN